MMTEPASISDLISKWPTIVEFAADVGCGYEAARQMRRRESVAPEHWAKLVDVCSGKGIHGVTFEWLARQRVSSESAA